MLFLDLNMPLKNSFECLTEIKHNKKLKQIPVIIFSTSYLRDANYEQDIINILYNIGAQHYIRKPDDFGELKKILHEALTMTLEKKTNQPPKEGFLIDNSQTK